MNLKILNRAIDKEPFQIPGVDNAELARVLARKGCSQIHLLGRSAYGSDSHYVNHLRKIYHASFDLASLFRMREPFDPKLLVRIGSLQAISLLACDLNEADWSFLSNHRSSLVVACLKRNSIGPEGAEKLASQFYHLKQLKTLDLGDNKIGPEGAEKLARKLHHLTQLRTLDLAVNGIGPERAEKLVQQLGRLKQFTTLGLGSNYIGPEGFERLAPQLRDLKHLTTLDLRSNNIGAGAEKLAAELQYLTQLTTLDLASNYIGADEVEKLAPQLRHLTQLRTLDLSINYIRAGVDMLAAQFPYLTQLRTLDLRDNKVGPWGGEKLANQLCHLTQLTTLDLGDNKIGPEGAEKLAQQLCHLAQLTTLGLESNKIGPEGAEKLAQQLCHLTQLTTLDLAANDIGPAGAEKLAQHLRHLTQLRTLGLGCNDIGPHGAEQLALQLRYLTQLTTLDLTLNNIGDEGTEKLAQQLHYIKQLTTFDLRLNGIGDAGVEILALAHDKGAMQRLREIVLTHNNIYCIDRTLLNTNDAQIIFRAALQGVALPHVRVMLVGMGGVGKTSLFRRCFQNKVEPRRRHQRTHDIDMIHAGQCEWKPRLPLPTPEKDGKRTSRIIEPTVWDFGGQLVLHGVHEAFLANDGRTIYVVVLDALQALEYGPGERDRETGNRLTYWLRTLRHFAGEIAPVVIAITKRDDASAEWLVDEPLQVSESGASYGVAQIPEDKLDLFRHTHGVSVVKIVDPCSARNESIPIEPLREAIEAALSRLEVFKDEKHGLVNKELPPLKKLVERELFHRTLVPLSEFRNSCRSAEVDAKDRTTQETFLRQLHYLGSLLYFGRTEREASLTETELGRRPPGEVRWLRANRTGILQGSVFNPNWLKYAVYSVIRLADRMAWVTEEELRRAVRLGTRRFVNADPQMRAAEATQAGPEFAAVKEFLELSELAWYDEDKRQYLLPRGLKTPLPDSQKWTTRRELAWEFLPEANFHRFIVRLHILKQVVSVEKKIEWQHGRNWVLMADAPLENGNNAVVQAKALLVAFPAEGRVEIRFDPTGERSLWQEMLNFVQHVFEREIQKKRVIRQPAPLGVQSAEGGARSIGDPRMNRDALRSKGEQPSIDVLVEKLPPAQQRDFLTYWLMVGPDGPCDGDETEEEIYQLMVAILEDSKSSQYRNLREAIIKHFRDTPLRRGKPRLVELRPGEKLEIPEQRTWGRNQNHVVAKFAADAKALEFLKKIGLGREHGKRQKRPRDWKRLDRGGVSGISHEFEISDEENE